MTEAENAPPDDEEAGAESEDDDRATLLEELDHLKVDLALKDAYAMELSARLAEREHEVGTLGHELGQAKDRVLKQDAELARLRAQVVQLQVQLDEITGRAGYRLLARASAWLDRHHRVRRVATGVARRLSRR
jgi:septal ring factor EnvC (AmiA/AmiB activator)